MTNTPNENTPTPNQGAYPLPNTHPWNVFPIGTDARGGDVTLDVQAHPHVFISGAGSSETSPQRALLAHALLNGEWRVAVIDPTGTEPSQHLNHSSVFRGDLDPQQAMEILQREMDARYDRMRDETVNYFRDLQQTPPPILIAVTDASALLGSENTDAETRSRIGILIGSLARLGRAAGIHLMLSTQQPGNDIGNDMLSPETMSNLDARITEEQKPGEGSLMVLQAGDMHTQFLPYTVPADVLP